MPVDRLGAVDVFHLRSHQEMVAQGLAGNACALALALDGKIDVEGLEQRIAQAAELVPELTYRLGRRYAVDPVWLRERPFAPPIALGRLPAGQELHEAVTRAIDAPIDGSRPWEVLVLRGDESDAVVLRWFQPLTDARGAARLMGWLGSEDLRVPSGVRQVADRVLEGLEPRERVALARSYFRHVMRLAKKPIASLGASRPAGGLASLRLRFDADTTAAFYRSLRKRAKLADTSVLLWSAVRMVDRALSARGKSPPQYLMPLPLSLDSGRDEGRMLGNHLTMMMMALDRAELADEASAVAGLARQRREIVRERLDVGMVAALDLVRHMPARLYSWASRRPFGGERSSLVVSNPGVLDIERFLGFEVRDAFFLPTVLVPPSFQVIAARHRGALSVFFIFRRGAIEQREVRELAPGFERDLLGA